MDKFMKNKVAGITIILIIFIVISFIIYKIKGEDTFKEENNNILVESEEEEEEMLTEEEAENIFEDSENIADTNMIIVEIKGEVKNPNVYEIAEGSIVNDLIDLAGGLTQEANIDGINRAEEVYDHQLVVIANKNEESTQSISSTNINTNTASSTAAANKLININTATAEELQTIPGIGEAKAQNIIAYREENGKFKSIEDIKNVDGIGDKVYEKLKDKIAV